MGFEPFVIVAIIVIVVVHHFMKLASDDTGRPAPRPTRARTVRSRLQQRAPAAPDPVADDVPGTAPVREQDAHAADAEHEGLPSDGAGFTSTNRAETATPVGPSTDQAETTVLYTPTSVYTSSYSLYGDSASSFAASESDDPDADAAGEEPRSTS